MKKITAIILILAMLAALAACNGETGAAANGASEVTESTNEQMQTSGITTATEGTEGDNQGKDTTGQTGAPTPTTTEPPTSTKPGTEKTEPAVETTQATTQPTQPTQPTTPVATEPPHQHSYSATVIAPTCNEKGYTKYTCACGYSYNDNYTAALGHHYIDEVIAPTTSAQGYTKHTCDRCQYSYNDSYTEPVKAERWDTEAVVAAVCADANAYIASLGLTVDPTSPCWVAPQYTDGWGDESWLRNQIWGGIDMYYAEGFTHMYVTYEPDPDGNGGWIVYVKHQLIGFNGWN